MDETLKTIMKNLTISEAHLYKIYLENQNIDAFIQDEHFTSTAGEYFDATHGVRLQVKESDAAKAMSLLKSY